MKRINILSLVVLVTMNVFTPISYAGEIPDNEVESPENVVENVVESVEDSQDPLEISEGQEEPELVQVVENDEEVKGKLFIESDRGLEVSLEASPIESQDGCYRYNVLNEDRKEIQLVWYSDECTGNLDLNKKVDDKYEIVSIGYKAVGYRTLDSIKMGKNISFVGYLGLGYPTEIEFPDGFDYNGLEIGEAVSSYDRYPGFVILGGENNCLLFDVGEKKIFEYDYERENCNGSEIVIPEKIYGFNVDGIHGFVQGSCGGWTPINSEITNTIIVPSTLKSIGESAACIPGIPMCSFEGANGQIELDVQANSSDFEYLGDQILVGVKPYPGSGLSATLTDTMLDAACMYRLEPHTVEFYDENGTLLTGIVVEGVIDESNFPEIEDEEGFGHSWVDKNGNPYNGEIVSENLKLYLRVSKIGISHDEVNGIIKISDGENEYWLRDRNVGASISTGVSKKELLMDLANEYANYNCGLISVDSSESIPQRMQEFLQKASEIIGSDETLTCEEILRFIDNFDQVEYRKSFGNYYFWGNNSYITYDEMNFNEDGYSTTVTEPESNIRLGKIHEDNTGWEEGKTSNPCDATKGEYLPTPKDWENLMRTWANLNGETIDNAENNEGRYQSRGLNTLRTNLFEPTYGTIGFHNYESYNKFADDVLLPFAGGINYQLITNHCASAVGNDCNMTYKYRYHNNPSNLRTARNNIGSIGLYEIPDGELFWSYYENIIDWGYEYEAYPVRCFVVANPATVQFDTDEGSDVEPYNVVKGTTIAEPATPTKTGYTLEGWYTEDGDKWDFYEDIVQGDMTLHAKWRVCGEGFEVMGNKCIPDGINFEGIIEVSDGNDVVYVRDRNVGATNVVLTDEMREDISDLLHEMCELVYSEEYQRICVEDTSLDCNNYVPDGQCEKEFYEEVSDILRYKVYTREQFVDFIKNYEYESSFGNFYYRGNNNIWMNYNDWELEGLYDGRRIINTGSLITSGVDVGNIGKEAGGGWIEGNINNPCDPNKGEYLPTISDWKKLITIRGNKNGYNVVHESPDDTEEYDYLNIGPDNYNQFHGDLLFPSAGLVYTYNRPGEYEMYYNDFMGVRLWAAQDKLDYIGHFNNNMIGYASLNSSNIENNSIAMPVRCFVNAPEVLVITLHSDGQVYKELNVVKGDTLEEPSAPNKPNNTFEGWYTKYGNKYDFDTPFTEDITLYAKWTENKGNGSSGGGGGGSSANKTDTTKEEKTNEDTKKTEQTEQTPAEPQEENNTQKSQVTPQGGQNSSQGSSTYSEESQEAYKFAYKHGITTKPTIEEANMDGPLTRIQMAKMLSQYAINVLGKKPNTSIVAKFNDVTGKRDIDYNNGVTLAYQLGIMGINMPNNKFRPDDIVTRGEFVTAFSRMLFNTSDGEYRSTPRYYVNHMEKLKNEGIVTKDNPKMEERRGYVMIMLMRSVTK